MDQEKELQFLSGEDNTDGLYVNGKVKWFKDKDGHLHYGEYYVPDDEILEAVGIKTKKLIDNHKGWLPRKVARKVAEHFKLKLFDKANKGHGHIEIKPIEVLPSNFSGNITMEDLRRWEDELNVKGIEQIKYKNPLI